MTTYLFISYMSAEKELPAFLNWNKILGIILQMRISDCVCFMKGQIWNGLQSD